ncbi:MAG: hypothetical protein GF313_03420 [Caldithrix sp.]|nr:hypothetical protein [Caldithrix sp.]
MKQFLNFWLKRPVSLSILTTIVCLLGIASLYHLPLERSPNVNFPKVTIQVYYPDGTPEMIEARIAAPIESRMQELSDLRKIESVSENTVARVILQFNRRADMKYMMFRINEILSDYKNWLPKGVARPSVKPFIPEAFERQRFLSYRLLTRLPEKKLYQLVEQEIKRPLLNVDGVAHVQVYGLRTPQVEVLLDLKRMQQFNLSVQDVRRKLRGKRIHVGALRNEEQRLPLSVDITFQQMDDLAKIPFKIDSRKVITLNQIAQIKQGFRPLRYKKRINGQHTLLIALQKESGSNTIQVADRVFETIDLIKTALPSGNHIMLVDDNSAQLRLAIRDLAQRTIFALLAIFLLLMTVVRRTSYTLIILVSIVLSILSVFIFIYAFSYSINLLTLAGLALGFGFIVDNAILVFDKIEGYTQKEYIVDQIQIIWFPILASTLTTISALLPFMFLMPNLKLLYVPFAMVVTSALISSVIFAYLFVPAAYWHWQKRMAAQPKRRILHAVEQFYEKFLSKIVRFRKLIFLLVLLSFGIPLWLLPHSLDYYEDKKENIWKYYIHSVYNNTIGSRFYQTIRQYTDPILGGATYVFFEHVQRGEPWQWWGDRNYLMVYLKLPQGSDIGLSENLILEFEQIALTSPGVGKIETTIYPVAASMRVDFPSETAFSLTPLTLKEKLIARAAEVGGAYVSVGGYGQGFSSGFGGVVSNFSLKLKGYNYLELKRLAQNIKARLQRNPRVREIDINASLSFQMSPLYELSMQIERTKMAQLGLIPADVIPYINLHTTRRLSADRIKIGLEEKYLNIQSKYYDRLQLHDLTSQWISIPGLPPFRLNRIAKVNKQKIQNEIRRENQQYIRKLSFDYLGPYRFGRDYLNDVLDDFSTPLGYSISTRYRSESDESEQSNMTMVIAMGLLFIFMVTAALYESFRDPFLIFLTIPAGLIGIFFTFYWSDTIFDRSAYIGVLFISGIVVNNSIILISKLKYWQNKGLNLKKAMVKGSTSHLRPLFLTSATTVLGFLPMIILADQQSGNLWYTLALTGISGIISAFVFILFVLPLLFYSIESIHLDRGEQSIKQ